MNLQFYNQLIQKIDKSRVLVDEPMKKHTTFKIGGAADVFLLIETEEQLREVLKTIKEIVLEAENYDVNVGIEGVWCFVINSPQKMKRLVDDLNSRNVKVIFDPVNYLNINNYQKQDEMINDIFTLLSDKICVLHAKDFVVEDGEFKMVKPTEGMLNYELIFKNMKEHNLDIPIICEEINEDEARVAFENLEKIWRN